MHVLSVIAGSRSVASFDPYSFTVMSSRCEVFRAMFSVAASEEDTESPLILSEIRPHIFLAVLEFIYTNCCSLSTNMVRKVA